MIAQVHASKAPAPLQPTSEEDQKWVSEVLAQARAFDGCEAIITLIDPTTGESLATSP